MHGIGLSDSNMPAFGWRFVGRAVATSFNVAWFVYLLVFYVAEGISHEFAREHPHAVWWIQLSALVVPFVVTLTILFSDRFLRSGRAKAFFGVGIRPTLVVIVSTYEHVKPYASESNERYCKIDLEKGSAVKPEGPSNTQAAITERPVRYLHGANGPVVGLETLRCAVTVYNNARSLLGFDIRLESDEIIAAGIADTKTLGHKTYLCLGSPGSNNVVQRLWTDKLPKEQSILPHFQPGGKLKAQSNVVYESSKDVDYAVVMKIHHGESVFFVCAGIDEEGTVASADWLLANWTEIYGRVKGDDFCMTLKVDKKIFRQPAAAVQVGDLIVKKPDDQYFNVRSKKK